jgi:hypothetical protein
VLSRVPLPQSVGTGLPDSQVMMGVHQLSPARSLRVAHRTNNDAGHICTTIGSFHHGRRLANPKGSCQRKIELF